MKDGKILRVGLVQQTNVADVSENRNRLERAVSACVERGAELVVLQELHNSLYFCQQENQKTFELAETIPGPSTQRFGELAARLQVVLVLSLFERRASGLYHNTAVVIEKDGSVAGMYRKMHIPDDPGFHEKFYFTPGDTGFEPISTSCGRLGVMVCWDQWFPEAARLMALKGAQILIYPTAIGWDPNDAPDERERQLEAWLTIQRAHAIANALPLVAVNRTGFEPDPAGAGAGISFWGNSLAAGPQGEILCRLPADIGEVAVIGIDLNRTEQVRQIWPFLRDRRIDAYGGINSRFLD